MAPHPGEMPRHVHFYTLFQSSSQNSSNEGSMDFTLKIRNATLAGLGTQQHLTLTAWKVHWFSVYSR